MSTEVAVITVPMSDWINLNSKVNQIADKLFTSKEKEPNPLLTPKEVMDILKIGRTTFDRYVRENIVSTTKISQKKGSRIYVERKELERLIENGLV